MVAFAPVSAFTGVSVRSANQAVSTRPVPAARVSVQANVHSGAGKGFGGGEATRDPNPTRIDPNDPKGKQKAIHAAEGWAEYQARMKGGSAGGVGRPSSAVGSPSSAVGRPSSSVGSPSSAVGRPSSAVGRPAASTPAASSGGSGTAATWAEYQAKIAREGGSSAGGAGAGSSWNSSPRGGTVGSSYNSSGSPSSPRGGSVGSSYSSSAPAKGGSSFGGGSRAPTSSSLDTLYGPGPGGASGRRTGGSTPASGSSVSTSVNTLYSAGGGASSSRSSGGGAPASPRGGNVGSRYASPASSSVHSGAGKGFGGGEATRDPSPTRINPNDPKGKQKAIHQAEGWAEYQARMAREGRR